MNIEINLDDYISEEERKQIVKDTFVSFLKRKTETDFERIFSNISYGMVFKGVDEEMDGKVNEIIKNKVIEVINGISAFHIFREKYYGLCKEEVSIAQQYLDDAVNHNKELIYEKVKEIVEEKISSLEREDKTKEIVEEVVYRVIHDKLVN